MQEAKLIYHKNTLDELFTLEGETISKISAFCLETNKIIETDFFISTTLPISFTLVVTIRKNEERRDR